MVRQYKRKGARPWRDKDKRMTAAMTLRAEGKSNRQIAKELGVNEITIRRDLRRWHEEHPNVVPLRHSGATNCPPRGEMSQPDVAPIASLNARRK